ncbi:MAG: hypothetical protein M1839_005200 [Geoglossum umbratile]|nr:MAG: hypothetical protein M1839_005200 [Geoglossum umbratile]
MSVYLKGPKPFAVVLCRFNDIPAFPAARQQLTSFVSSGGRGGLFDFWRDVSYANIDLSGSEVFGWYTMNYSFARDGSDPLHDGKTRGRLVWISEAIRLCKEHGVDMSRFYGVIAVVNANVDDSSDGRHNTAIAIGQYNGQGDWRHCNKCDEIVFTGNNTARPCASGGSHDTAGSTNYRLSLDNNLFVGQNGWKWCNKCQALCFTPLGPHPCPPGGTHSHVGSGSYRVGTADLGYPGQDQWRSCTKCQCLAFGGDTTPGACAAGGTHDYASSFNYKLVGTNDSFNDTFSSHETGHCLGLSHSWSANPDTEYGDQFDIMSAMNVRAFANKNPPGSSAGPGLNAPTLYKLGWLPQNRVSTYKAISDLPVTVTLTALNRPENGGNLMARVLSPNHVYTIEFRQANGWDAGIGADAVLVHELRSCYTTGQKDWRWCRKCNGLAWNGQARCPAGSLHNYAGSMNYRVVSNDPSHPGQDQWRSCRKCSLLSYSANPGSPGPCPAGGTHNQSGSKNYTLRLNDTTAPGQSGWKWCSKCEGISFSLNGDPGTCAAGGLHDHSGSANYTISGDDPSAPGDPQWRWCSKCQGLAADGYSHCAVDGLAHDLSQSSDYGLSTNDTEYPGQDQWEMCWKCDGLFFTGLGPRPCAAGGNHDTSGSAMVRLMRTEPDLRGQSQWKSCSKCQLLSFVGFGGAVNCPTGGNHDHSQSWDYTLANFGDDRTFLIEEGFLPGQEFADTNRKVRIQVDNINSVAGTATVTIGKTA